MGWVEGQEDEEKLLSGELTDSWSWGPEQAERTGRWPPLESSDSPEMAVTLP